MKIDFTKMQGCGNDYVYIDLVGSRYMIKDKSDLARRISDRHFGVGSDGLIFIKPSENADFEMEMYNADGSRAEMCGNGIRCVAKYVYDHDYISSERFNIESMGNVKHITVFPKEGYADKICVDMGAPVLRSDRIPVISEHIQVIGRDLTVDGKNWKVTCVSMGNPHAVVFSGIEGSYDFDLSSLDIEHTGPLFEHHEAFPARINTEFVHVTDRGHIELRVGERGAGETLACGTGCCAALTASVLGGFTDREAQVTIPGGVLDVKWDETDGHIYMTGPAAYAFTGTYEY